MRPTSARASLTVRRRLVDLALAAGLTLVAVLPATTPASAHRRPPDREPVVGYQWSDPSPRTYHGLRVEPCGGDAPLACVYDGDVALGGVERLSIPVDGLAILAGVSDERRAIALVAGDFLASFRADRTAACPDLTFREIGPRPAVVAGRPGLSWGFELSRGGVVVERTLDYGLVDGDTLELLVANAADDGACAPYEGGFTIAGLTRFGPAFRALARSSRF